MTGSAVTEGLQGDGIKPGEAVRDLLDGPDQEALFAEMDREAAIVDQQFSPGGRERKPGAGGKHVRAWKRSRSS